MLIANNVLSIFMICTQRKMSVLFSQISHVKAKTARGRPPLIISGVYSCLPTWTLICLMGLVFVPVLYSASLDNNCNGTVALYGGLNGYIGYINIAHRPMTSACL